MPVDELPAAREDRRQRLGLLIRQGPWLWSHDLGEVRQGLGVHGIGFGQLPAAFAKPRTCRGLTTTRTPAAANTPVSGISNPPLASNTTSLGCTVLRRSKT